MWGCLAFDDNYSTCSQDLRYFLNESVSVKHRLPTECYIMGCGLNAARLANVLKCCLEQVRHICLNMGTI